MKPSLKTFVILVFVNQVLGIVPSKYVKMGQLEKLSKILEPKNLLEVHFNGNKFDTEIYSTCERDIFLYLNEIKVELNEKVVSLWAMKMLDASSKIPSGILAGNIIDLGMFDECISVLGIVEKIKIRGRYCLYSFQIPRINLPVTLSICLPSSCEAQDLINIFENVKNKTNGTFDLENKVFESFTVSCSSVSDREISTGAITTIIILATIVLFLLICTFLQLVQEKMNISSKFVRELSKLSLYSSAKRIFNTNINPSSFPALHGIRTLSIFWVVLGHSYTSRSLAPFVNSAEEYKWFTKWNSLYIFLAPFAVDTFFMISGFLMTYLFLKEMKNGQKFNIFLYYFHRYMRLTPVVAVLLLIIIYILPYLGSGPIWEKAMESHLSGSCKKKWWTILIYMQNYVKTDLECLGHTWYLAADMHFYLISPIILIPLSKKPKLGLVIISVFFIASLLTVGTLIAVNGYISTLYSNSVSLNIMRDSFRLFYTASHTRASAWIVGIYLGFTVHENSKKLNKTSRIVGWIGAVGCFTFCTLGQRIFLEESYIYNVTFETIFGMFSRPLWASGVAWIVYASIYGNGGIVGKFLSLSIFLPLSRISYCIYLVHATIQIAKVNTTRTADYFTEFKMFTEFLNEIIITVVAAFFFSIFFESPIMILEKMILRKK